MECCGRIKNEAGRPKRLLDEVAVGCAVVVVVVVGSGACCGGGGRGGRFLVLRGAARAAGGTNDRGLIIDEFDDDHEPIDVRGGVVLSTNDVVLVLHGSKEEFVTA